MPTRCRFFFGWLVSGFGVCLAVLSAIYILQIKKDYVSKTIMNLMVWSN